jgi:hypothetical protein
MPLNVCWFSEVSFQIDMERGSAMTEGYICYFLTEVIKFYWLMLLYLGELYRLLGASSCCMFILVKKLSSFIYMLLYPGELCRLLGASSCCMFILVKKELIPILYFLSDLGSNPQSTTLKMGTLIITPWMWSWIS